MLEHGAAAQRSSIMQSCRGDIVRLARHRCGSRVVDSALIYCCAQDQQSIACELLGWDGITSNVVMLARQQFAANALLTLATSHTEALRIQRQFVLSQLA